jgi:hypothetical protein
MKTILSIIGGFFVLALIIGFICFFGYLWDHKEDNEFVIGALSLIGWMAIGALIVVWIARLAYPKK